jgi:hypothetical protein
MLVAGTSSFELNTELQAKAEALDLHGPSVVHGPLVPAKHNFEFFANQPALFPFSLSVNPSSTTFITNSML